MLSHLNTGGSKIAQSLNEIFKSAQGKEEKISLYVERKKTVILKYVEVRNTIEVQNFFGWKYHPMAYYIVGHDHPKHSRKLPHVNVLRRVHVMLRGHALVFFNQSLRTASYAVIWNINDQHTLRIS